MRGGPGAPLDAALSNRLLLTVLVVSLSPIHPRPDPLKPPVPSLICCTPLRSRMPQRHTQHRLFPLYPCLWRKAFTRLLGLVSASSPPIGHPNKPFLMPPAGQILWSILPKLPRPFSTVIPGTDPKGHTPPLSIESSRLPYAKSRNIFVHASFLPSIVIQLCTPRIPVDHVRSGPPVPASSFSIVGTTAREGDPPIQNSSSRQRPHPLDQREPRPRSLPAAVGDAQVVAPP